LASSPEGGRELAMQGELSPVTRGEWAERRVLLPSS
jgi:hypothetical protein